MLKHNMKGAPQGAKLQAYLMLVRPHLKYCIQAWSPYYERFIPTSSIPTLSIPTSSIPIWSTSHFVNSHFVNSHFVNSHLVNVDKVGIDKVEVGSWRSGKVYHLYTFNYCYWSVNFLVHRSNLMSGDDKTVWCPWVWWNSCQLSQTREEIDFRGEWTRTAREEHFLLVDTGQNDQNRLVPFATVGNLEKFYEAETIYIDRAIPQLFYQLFRVHAGQPIHHPVNSIPTSSSHRQHHIFWFLKIYFTNSHLVNFPFCQFSLCQHWPNGNWQSGNWRSGKIPYEKDRETLERVQCRAAYWIAGCTWTKLHTNGPRRTINVYPNWPYQPLHSVAFSFWVHKFLR